MSPRSAIRYLAEGIEQSWLPAGDGLVPGEAADGAQLLVVLDSPDEMHVVTHLPAVRGSHATRLLQRRLEREFPETPLRAAIRLRRRGLRGPSDAVLIAAGADADLRARLARLGERHALCALTTPALLVAGWLRQARLRPRRLLVVLPTPAGLRLVFIEDGQPSLSRLMPPVDMDGGTALEIGRTIEYLQNTQRVERNVPLEIWFWGMTAAAAEACRPEGGAHVAGAAPRIERLPDPQRDGWQALLVLASERHAGVQLATDELRLGWFAREAGRWSRRLAAGLLLVAVATSALQYARTRSLQQQTAQLAASSSAIDSDHSALDARLAGRGLQLEDVRVLPDAADALRAGEVRLEEVFDIFGRSLGANADVQLATLEFRSLPPAAPDSAPAFNCDGQDLPEAPAAKGVIWLREGLDVRRRAAALQQLRESLTRIAPWQPTPASARIGVQEAVTVAAGSDQPPVREEWTLCLTRGVAS